MYRKSEEQSIPKVFEQNCNRVHAISCNRTISASRAAGISLTSRPRLVLSRRADCGALSKIPRQRGRHVPKRMSKGQRCQRYVSEEYNHHEFLHSTKRIHMKVPLNIFSVMLILAGSVFLLQGIGMLPGSFMTGNPQWAVIGSVMIAVGISLILWSNLRR